MALSVTVQNVSHWRSYFQSITTSSMVDCISNCFWRRGTPMSHLIIMTGLRVIWIVRIGVLYHPRLFLNLLFVLPTECTRALKKTYHMKNVTIDLFYVLFLNTFPNLFILEMVLQWQHAKGNCPLVYEANKFCW